MAKVDLFIPTYNRPDFLRRILSYYQNYKFKHQIIIADSSSDLNKKLNKKVVLSFPKLKILYIDNFSSSKVSHQKFGEMLKYAKAKYSVFCADDDFLIPSGIDDAVQFLEKNPDYSAAHGTYISFYINDSIPFFDEFLWRYIYPYESISDSKPIARLQKHLSDYYQVLWAVRRTEQVKQIYKEFLDSGTSPVLFGELLPDILTLVKGKMKRLNNFYSARQAFSTAYGYWPTLQDAKKLGTYDKEYEKFRECLISSCKKAWAASFDSKSSDKIDSSMDRYLAHSNQEHLTYQLNLMLRKFPQPFGDLVRKLHIVYLYSKKNADRIGAINNPNSKFYNDFITLKEHVLNN